MKIFTQIGFLDINPSVVASIKPAIAVPGKRSFNDLSYCIDFKDELYIDGHHVVNISETDALKLSELSGIKINEREAKGKEIPKFLFVPFRKLLILNEWEKTFDNAFNPEVNPI